MFMLPSVHSTKKKWAKYLVEAERQWLFSQETPWVEQPCGDWLPGCGAEAPQQRFSFFLLPEGEATASASNVKQSASGFGWCSQRGHGLIPHRRRAECILNPSAEHTQPRHAAHTQNPSEQKNQHLGVFFPTRLPTPQVPLIFFAVTWGSTSSDHQLNRKISLFMDSARSTDSEFFRWSIGKILRWKSFLKDFACFCCFVCLFVSFQQASLLMERNPGLLAVG